MKRHEKLTLRQFCSGTAEPGRQTKADGIRARPAKENRQMPECHKCKWDKKPPTDEKTVACLKCVAATDYSNLTNKGRTFVSFDSGKAPQTAAQIQAAQEDFLRNQNADCDPVIDPGDPLVKDAMKLGAIRAIQFIHELDADQRDVLFMAVFSTLSEYARTIKKTRACTSKWWREIVAVFPELEPVVFSNITNPNARTHGRVKAARGTR